MKPLSPRRLIWFSVALLVFASAIRLYRILELPMFTDEVLHITRAHRIVTEGDTFDGLEQNKWLYVFTLAQLNPTGPEGPWLARYLNVLFAAVSLSGCVALGRQLDQRSTGLLAGAIYMLLPMATFHERQALVDPMMTAFGTLSIVTAVQLIRTPKLGLVIPLGLSLTAALLTKPAAAPYLMMPFVAALFLSVNIPPSLLWRVLCSKSVRFALIGVATAVVATVALYQIAAATGTSPHDTHTFRYANTGIGRFGLMAFVTRTPQDIGVLIEIFWKYGGPGLIILTLLGLWAGVSQPETRRVILFLSIPAFIFAALPVLASRPTASDDIATRYLLPNAAGLVVLASIGFRAAVQRVNRRWLAPLLLILLFAPMIWFTFRLYTDPTQANLTRYDRRIYVDSSTSGYRYRDVALYLQDQSGSGNITGVGHGTTMLHASAYLGPRISDLHPNRPDSEAQQQRIDRWWAADQSIYVVEWLGTGDNIAGPSGTTLKYLYTTEPWQQRDPVMIYQVISVD